MTGSAFYRQIAMNYPVNDHPAVMTSLDIADLVDSRHDNVKRTIERLVTTGVISQPPMEDGEKAANGVVMKMYVFEGERGKRDSIVVVAQLSPEFTARLVDRWQELEKAIAQPVKIPQSLPEALRLAADLAEQKAVLESQLAIAAPKAEFVDSYVEAKGAFGFREVAKILGVKETLLRSFLIDKEIVYYLAGKMTAHAQHLDAGRFVVKTGENHLNGAAYSQLKFTPKGVQWIASLLGVSRMKGVA